LQCTVAGVDGIDLRGASLKQTIGKPAGVGAEVGADESPDIQRKGCDRMIELLAGSGDEAGHAVRQSDSLDARHFRVAGVVADRQLATRGEAWRLATAQNLGHLVIPAADLIAADDDRLFPPLLFI